MARSLVIALLFLGACIAVVVSQEESSEGVPSVTLIRLGCRGHISFSLAEPHVFGGLMLRGRGPLVVARGVPAVSRIAFLGLPSEDETTDSAPEVPFPFHRGLAEDDDAASGINSLLELRHPLSILQQNVAELGSWQEARLRALEEMHSRFLEQFVNDAMEVRGGPSDDASTGEPKKAQVTVIAAENSAVDEVPADVAGASDEAASSSLAEVEGFASTSEGDSDKGFWDGEEAAVSSTSGQTAVPGDIRVSRSLEAENVIQAFEDPVAARLNLDAFEWTLSSVCGLMLLVLAFGLLLGLLFLSLASLIYGCSKEPGESIVESETHVKTPLLKYLEAAAKEDAEQEAVANPVCKYQPPAGKA